VLFEKNEWTCLLIDEGISSTLKQIVESMKKEEHSRTVVEPDWVKGNDFFFGPLLENEKDLLEVELKLKKLIKVEDWFSDATTYKKLLLRGKADSKPFYDSTILCLLKFMVDEEVWYDNFPKNFDIDNSTEKIVLP
jgi:hypothetical protein